MVGIHARTGREKIFSQQIAHVLNDETQRKYIQVQPSSTGRLISLCEYLVKYIVYRIYSRKFLRDPIFTVFAVDWKTTKIKSAK